MGDKIKLAVMSDLHNEFERFGGPRRPTSAWFQLREKRAEIPGHPLVGPLLDGLLDQEVDLVVMAGDIDVGVHGISYAEQVSIFLRAPVAYVMGNHEAYGGRDLSLLEQELRAAADGTAGRVRFLENEEGLIPTPRGWLHILGCTLWTDYRLNGDEDRDVDKAMSEAEKCLNDHARVFLRGRRFTPEMARQRHEASRRWLGQEIGRIKASEGPAARILVVTHHAPVPDANPPQYRGVGLSPAFASDLTAEIAEWQPTAWVWGHTHHSVDTWLGATRLISEQRGYVSSEPGADTFVPRVIEI